MYSYSCFIDYREAFDNLKQGILVYELQTLNQNQFDIRLISYLYWVQMDSINESVETRKEVRQGCILSSILFNFYSEIIFETAFEAGSRRNCGLCHVNQKHPADWQRMIHKVSDVSKKFDLTMNIKKTKCIVITKYKVDPISLQIDNETNPSV